MRIYKPVYFPLNFSSSTQLNSTPNFRKVYCKKHSVYEMFVPYFLFYFCAKTA